MPSFVSSKVKIGSSKTSGKGLFAIQPIHKGEILVDYTDAKAQWVDTQKAIELYDGGLDHMIQVDDDLYLAATGPEEIEDADHVNHSCNPNCGIKDKLKIVAMRDIEAGEELTIDYAMMESSDYSFPCSCGSVECRGRVSGDDWKIPELQRRYTGYFSDYLQKKIDLLR